MKSVTSGSLFAGIGGFDLGFERAGMRCAWQVEKDKNCLKLLGSKWPDVPKLNDVCADATNSLPYVDVICGGFPCQDLSVAGKRKGLKGKRSGLFYDATRIISKVKPQIAVLENVPGLYSSNHGWDFAQVLFELAKLGALDIGWCVLDSQWRGVAQRRERVFIVADFRACRSSEILSLAEGLQGNPPPCREAREEVAGTLGCRTQGGFRQDLDRSGAFVTGTLNANGKAAGSATQQDAECGMLVTHTLRSEGADAIEDGTGRGTSLVTVLDTLKQQGNILQYGNEIKTDTDEALLALRREIREKAFAEWGLGILASFFPQEVLQSAVYGTGIRFQTIEEFGLVNYSLSRQEDNPARFVQNMRETQRKRCSSFGWEPHEQRSIKLATYLSSLSHPGTSGEEVLHSLWRASQRARLLRQALPEVCEVGESGNSKRQPIHQMPEGVRNSSEEDLLDSRLWEEVSRQWVLWKARNAGSQGKAGVRRLTVIEAEFLQGFPRNYTAGFSDSVRYRMLGNAVTVPVAEYLGHQIMKIIKEKV